MILLVSQGTAASPPVAADVHASAVQYGGMVAWRPTGGTTKATVRTKARQLAALGFVVERTTVPVLADAIAAGPQALLFFIGGATP